jgi:uncharacterized protein YkwD
MMNTRRLKLGAIAAAIAGLLPARPADAADPACPAADEPVDHGTPATVERSLRCLINRERLRHGLGRVYVDSRLALAGRRHARDMVRRSYFSHVSPAGSRLADRIRRSGYVRGRNAWTVGEILAWGTGRASTPRTIVRQWLKSPPHRRVMLHRRFDEVGVGVAPGAPKRDAAGGVTAAAELGID